MTLNILTGKQTTSDTELVERHNSKGLNIPINPLFNKKSASCKLTYSELENLYIKPEEVIWLLKTKLLLTIKSYQT